MADDEVEKYMTPLNRNELFDEWAVATDGLTYTAWLEKRVRQVSLLSTMNL